MITLWLFTKSKCRTELLPATAVCYSPYLCQLLLQTGRCQQCFPVTSHLSPLVLMASSSLRMFPPLVHIRDLAQSWLDYQNKKISIFSSGHMYCQVKGLFCIYKSYRTPVNMLWSFGLCSVVNSIYTIYYTIYLKFLFSLFFRKKKKARKPFMGENTEV